MKLKTIAIVLACACAFAGQADAEPPLKPGGPSQGSEEMKALLKSFNLTADQQAEYDAAQRKTGKQIREIQAGKRNGTLPPDEALRQAQASHRAFNDAVKKILTPEQYAKWEPLRESDHDKSVAAQKAREEEAAKKKKPADSR